jgi:hypothetical protein
VRNTIWRIALASIFSLYLLAGCGSDRMERGLTADPEEAVPGEEQEFEMTQAERQAQEIREEEEKEQKAFDEARER